MADAMTTRSIVLATLAILPLTTHADFAVHEWGTFTTVSGSDGALLTGLQREEEALPRYVRHHPGFGGSTTDLVSRFPIFTKKVPLPVQNVKVKMETPVLYFHSDHALKAKVEVGFEGGTISQWYPERSGGETLPEKTDDGRRAILDFSKPYSGSIQWDIDVLSPQDSRDALLFKPDDLLQWTRARIPEANVVRTSDGETEGFLFYRGLGSFEPGLDITVSSDETLQLRNRTGGTIPYLLIYERFEDGSTRWLESSSALKTGESLEVPESEMKQGATGFDHALYTTLRDHLAAQGLLRSEADAMVQTWWKSYFEAPGLRVFWVLPSDRTDAILPLSVTPAPDETVRVLVGRSEVIRPRREKEWLHLSTSGDKTEQARWMQLRNDRFGLAYEARVQSLRQTAAKGD